MSSLVFKDASSLLPLHLSVSLAGIFLFTFLFSEWYGSTVPWISCFHEVGVSLSECFSIFLTLHHCLCFKISNLARLCLYPLLHINFSSIQCALLFHKFSSALLPGQYSSTTSLNTFRPICWATY